jgi:hypothetical protein
MVHESSNTGLAVILIISPPRDLHALSVHSCLVRQLNTDALILDARGGVARKKALLAELQ